MVYETRFLSTPSARRATFVVYCESSLDFDFYPRPPRGGRQKAVRQRQRALPFLSTPSARRATPTLNRKCPQSPNFYPRPPRGGRLSSASFALIVMDFYPRPPRGGRPVEWAKNLGIYKISIHALREEGDAGRTPKHHAESNFYPRPPRGGRPWSLRSVQCRRYFYPRPPRGGRPGSSDTLSSLRLISIHALREEGDFR